MAKADTTFTMSMSPPRWIAEPGTRQNQAYFPAKLDAASFTDRDAISVIVGAGGAAQNATTVPITAITFPVGISKIPSGTWLNFGGAKVAKLTADYTGGTSITVSAIPTALVANDTATYLPFGTRVAVESGTLVGRTRTERNAGTGFGPWAAGDEEVFLVLFDVSDATRNNDVSLLQNLTTIKENYLPKWATLSLNAPWLAAVRAAYRTITGVN